MTSAASKFLSPLIAGVVVAFCACSQMQDSLRSQLLMFEGRYDWYGQDKRFVLHDPAKLEQQVANRYKQNPRTLDELVDCMSDTTPSKLLLEGKPVPLGQVCYEALTMLIYFEPDTESKSSNKPWRGYISAKAKDKEREAAQTEWRKVVQQHLYSNL